MFTSLATCSPPRDMLPSSRHAHLPREMLTSSRHAPLLATCSPPSRHPKSRQKLHHRYLSAAPAASHHNLRTPTHHTCRKKNPKSAATSRETPQDREIRKRGDVLSSSRVFRRASNSEGRISEGVRERGFFMKRAFQRSRSGRKPPRDIALRQFTRVEVLGICSLVKGAVGGLIYGAIRRLRVGLFFCVS
jgi:hypothetical protein